MPRAWARAITSLSRRVLPTPASADSRTLVETPSTAVASTRSNSASSWLRPMNGVREVGTSSILAARTDIRGRIRRSADRITNKSDSGDGRARVRTPGQVNTAVVTGVAAVVRPGSGALELFGEIAGAVGHFGL